MTVRQNQIRVAVVVVIEKTQAPATEKTRCCSNLARLVDEGQILLVLIETEQLLIDVGDEQILPAIAVDIRSVNAHSRAWRTRITVRDASHQAFLFKLAIAFVDEEKVCQRVVRDEEIH